MPTQTLTAKGKQGAELLSPDYIELGIDTAGKGFIEGVMGVFLPTTIATYSYGLKGKPKDIVIQAGTADTDDFATTGAGNDTISTGGGNDIIVAGDGNDTLNGGAGNDILIGGAGDDTINPGLGNNYIDGGDGNDTYDMSDSFGGNPVIVVDLNAGTVKVDGTLTDYLVSIENVQGNSKYNVIIGDDGINVLSSGSGGAAIVGNKGDDTISLGSTNADKVYWAELDGTDTIVFFDADGASDNDTLYIDFAGADLTYQQMVDGGYLSFGEDVDGTLLVLADLDGGGDNYDTVARMEGYTYVPETTEDAVATAEMFSNNIVDGAFALGDFLV